MGSEIGRVTKQISRDYSELKCLCDTAPDAQILHSRACKRLYCVMSGPMFREEEFIKLPPRRSEAWRKSLVFKGTLTEHLLNVFHKVHSDTDGALARFSSRDPGFHSVPSLFNLRSACGRLLSISAEHPLLAHVTNHMFLGFLRFPPCALFLSCYLNV